MQDLFLVVHDKVYNATTFIDEHPYVHPCYLTRARPANIPRSPITSGIVPIETHDIYLEVPVLTLLGNRGGEEVLLDVGGQDATEAFEDVGHSDEAREILDGLKVGDLKRMVC